MHELNIQFQYRSGAPTNKKLHHPLFPQPEQHQPTFGSQNGKAIHNAVYICI